MEKESPGKVQERNRKKRTIRKAKNENEKMGNAKMGNIIHQRKPG